MAKPKILCLHGFGESAELFKIRTRNIRAVVGEHAELVYPDGPIDIGSLHMTTGDLVDPEIASEFTNLGWWWMRRGRSFEARGIGKTLDLIGKLLTEQGPFDGIVGFSQGAALAIVICALLAGREGPLSLGAVEHPQMKFLLLAGAFQLEVPEYEYLYQGEFDVPSLHIVGAYDTVVEPERSRQVQGCFAAPEVFEFVGGHFIPQSPKCARIVRRFLAPFVAGLDAEDAGAGAAVAEPAAGAVAATA
ncbi:Ovarian cancer-associated protein 2 [Coemansia sp. RSA 2711]|nr:Ovarian cancer-associated protein 2 [Coemansia sp. RSA 2711]KAJ2297021.1 Ovarian cancer-associated protein 2 [Coemansia sp. RSA 2705]KAJ2319983.1 Ovarian cancer-associated protein 2 [Coemansia sp. RSA 2704]KAJ2738083.1 Ovarian cancer-associated protein 2 [Coemansia sp. Cherry 401B]